MVLNLSAFRGLSRIEKAGEYYLLQGSGGGQSQREGGIRKVTGKKSSFTPHHDIMGAIGSAMIAMEERHGRVQVSRV